MGTTVELLLPEHHAAAGTEAVRLLFAQWEDTLSRFRPESELSRLNQQTGESVQVSELLFSVLVTALAAARATNGLYDPTLREALLRLGYDRSFETLPTVLPTAQPILAGYLPRTAGWRDILVDERRRMVTLPEGVTLDFGGIAKGMAVDAAVTRLRAMAISPALVNAGGDLAVTSPPTSLDSWPIAVPLQDTHCTLPLRHGAVATSGVARRHWRQGERERHHLLDPRTGEPAQSGLWSVTAVAARCEQAEIAAKTAFILGPDDGAAFLRDHHLAGLFVREDGTWLTAGDWPETILEHLV